MCFCGPDKGSKFSAPERASPRLKHHRMRPRRECHISQARLRNPLLCTLSPQQLHPAKQMLGDDVRRMLNRDCQRYSPIHNENNLVLHRNSNHNRSADEWRRQGARGWPYVSDPATSTPRQCAPKHDQRSDQLPWATTLQPMPPKRFKSTGRGHTNTPCRLAAYLYNNSQACGAHPEASINTPSRAGPIPCVGIQART